jgi:hypothetical protein
LNGKCVPTCLFTQVMCSGQCIDPSTDDAHCGASATCDLDAGTAGSACVSPARCVNGSCQ